MSRRHAVHYSKDAEADLDAIARYTLEQWGQEQCAKYLALLELTCEAIIPRNLKHARPVPRRPELLRWRCERHVIYVRRVSGGIEIVRILHERMLPDNHV
jgi:toxin ParE1/3/4